MGRKTFDSIGRPLPERRNIVISRQKALEIPGCEVVTSLDEALRLVEHDSSDEVFVIGGGEIYRQAMPHADRIYLTRVHGEFMGDTFFPEMDEGEWKEVSREERGIDERHTVSRAFIVLDRKK
jgi:dihydrofolate reductase